jgi:DNA primase
MKTRIIIPVVWQNKNIGFVARGINPDIKPKYYAQVQPGSLFNLDRQHWSRKFVILVEGVFDAIMLDAVAILGSEINAKQKQQIDALNRKVIIVPDRDRAGSKLIDQACDWGWSVSMPPWHEGIKDVNNAVLKYGKILTMQAILKHTHNSRTKIKLNEKLWLN